MRDRKIRATEWTVLAAQELLLERPVIHSLDEEERSRPELDGLVAVMTALARVMVGILIGPHGRREEQEEAGRKKREHERKEMFPVHERSPADMDDARA